MTSLQSNFTKNDARSRRGFAVIMAISMILLVGAALATVGVYFAHEAKRTQAQGVEAQLRQLLTAGGVAAVERAGSATAASGEEKAVELPVELASRGASVTVRIDGSGDERTALVTAQVVTQLGARHMEQSLKLHRAGEKWSVVAAELEPSGQAPASTQPSERSTAASQRS